MGNGNSNFLVAAKDNFRVTISAIVNDGIVDASKDRSGVEGGILDIISLHEVHDQIGTELRLLCRCFLYSFFYYYSFNNYPAFNNGRNLMQGTDFIGILNVVCSRSASSNAVALIEITS